MVREPSFEYVAAIAEIAAEGNLRDLVPSDKLLLSLPLAVLDTGNDYDGLTVLGARMPLMTTLAGTSIYQALTLAAGARCVFARDRVLGLLAIPAVR